MPIFDTCVITASGEKQAAVFRKLIDRRREGVLYPREIDFRVYADPPGGRVGSGGGTVWALTNLLREDGVALEDRSVLVIHAGGESRRLPAYMGEGKLFAPVSADSSAALPPVVLDLELSLFLKYPWRRGEVLVASGDALIDFNTDLFDPPDAPLYGFAAPAPFEQGSRHGVFAFDPLSGAVKDYYQKASIELLSQRARISGTESCALDLGLVSFRGQALEALLGLSGATLSGSRLIDILAQSKLSFDLYLELLTACLSNIDRDEYFRRLEGKSGAETAFLNLLFDSFHPLGLSGVLVKQSSFIHFGSVAEYPAACRELRSRELKPFYSQGHEELAPLVTDSVILFDSLAAEVRSSSGGTCVENCRNVQLSCEGENLLVGLRDFALPRPLPRGFCLDERSINGTKVRLVYHRDDSFKVQSSLDSVRFCAQPLTQWLSDRHISLDALIPPSLANAGAPVDLQALALFVEGDDRAFLEGYWRLPEDREAWRRRFMALRRYSIAELNGLSDAALRDEEREDARRIALAQTLNHCGFFAVSARDFRELATRGLDLGALTARCAATEDPLLKVYRSSLLRSVGAEGFSQADRIEVSFAPSGGTRELRCALKLDQIVWARAPLRLDIAGGWTDTPPYTNRYGGAVVNVAVDLNGQSPIQVFVRRTSEPVLRIHSIDLGADETIVDTASLRAYGDPGSPFSLPRAAMVLLGLGAGLPDGAPLGPVLAASGGGLEITLLCAVPKGSGLGTSSVLAGTILAALERFYGRIFLPEELFLQVLEVEQMLTTGGGWQDQIGGLVGGLKYVESKPAIKPRPVIRQLDPWVFEDSGCTERMTLFYTGVTRLAKNILREVVNRVNGMNRAYLFTHDRLRSLAQEARDAVSLRDLDALARIVDESFRENKLIHESTTNAEIEVLARETAPYYRGMKLLGAGGGGFALFLSKDAESAKRLRALLSSRFEDDRARLVDFSLNKKGLEVTVS